MVYLVTEQTRTFGTQWTSRMKSAAPDPRQARRIEILALAALVFLTYSAPAATSRVTNDFPTVSLAYDAARNDDTIEIQSGLYLIAPPLLPGTNKHVYLQAAGGRVVFALTNAPINDNPGGAVPLSGREASAFAYNYAARREANELDHQDYTNFSRSLWWSWVAPTNGQAIVAVVDNEFPALLDVFGVSNSFPILLPSTDFFWRSNNEASLRVTNGTTYLLRVAADGGSYGGASVHVVMPRPPPNDRFTNALPLDGKRLRVTGNTYAATEEGDPVHLDGGAGASVWYVWTAPTNTGHPGHPVTLTTAGSDFDTLLAVYCTNSDDLPQLVTANDDRGGIDRFSHLVFEPEAGRTYFFALDGTSKRQPAPVRDTVGNFSFRLAYPWLNLRPRVLRREYLDNGMSEAVRITAEFVVDHFGSEPVGPLRIRVVGRTTNTTSGIHLLGAAGEMTLTNLPVTLSLNGPGGQGRIVGEIICPPPHYPEDERPAFWGVFAMLEEQDGDNWFNLDSDFVDYGHVPPGGDGGLHFGVGRTFQRLQAQEAEVVEDFAITNAPYATDQSTAELVLVALLSTGEGDRLRAKGVTNWIVMPGEFRITNNRTNAILTVGDLNRSTNVLIRAEFRFGGEAGFRGPVSLPIYKRPSLVLLSGTNVLRPVPLTLTGYTSPFRIEWTDAFRGSNTAWLPLNTNVVTTFITNLPGLDRSTRFFRARLLP